MPFTLILAAALLQGSAPAEHDRFKPLSEARSAPKIVYDIPMSNDAWRRARSEARDLYAHITVEALKLGPDFATCDALTARALRQMIETDMRDGEPLMMAVARAAYQLCPSPPIADR